VSTRDRALPSKNGAHEVRESVGWPSRLDSVCVRKRRDDLDKQTKCKQVKYLRGMK
jgi:hypothetical protein